MTPPKFSNVLDANRPRHRELELALAEAKQHAKLTATATNSEERDYHSRMRRKWMGIAEGWRMINEIDKCSS